ncbi:MAG: DUF2169 domain-containing protein [Gemmatimonadaceae bacterium]|nr:DUF2169 domain-containing protein [Gemmatimonadaceae bacterium]
MPHPEIDNRTPFAFAPLFIADEEGRPVISTIVKATFDVSSRGVVTVAEKQEEVDFGGKHHGEPGKSSVRIDPEVAFIKPTTDCVLLGHATSVRPTNFMDVSFGVGPVFKNARVTGDRWWVQGAIGLSMTSPEPFESMPLVYERAFGGWDRTSENPKHHDCEPRNPVGVGFVGRHGSPVHGTPVPNIEDPQRPLTSAGGRCPPVGFGFIGCEWHPRASFAGTFDEAWTKNRSPLLPTDFDRRFFNAASEGLVAPDYLNGDEMVATIGVTLQGRWGFQLPGVCPPLCTVGVRFGESLTLQTNLDTVIVDADARRVTLLWRAFGALRTGPHDVSAIRIESGNVVWQPDDAPSAAKFATVS